MDNYKRYYEVKENHSNTKATHLKAEVYYNLGGQNFFTGREERRGYYISISPVVKSDNFESYAAFTGLKVCILEVKRKSQKKFEEAKSKFTDTIEDFIKNQFSEFEVDFSNYEERWD